VNTRDKELSVDRVKKFRNALRAVDGPLFRRQRQWLLEQAGDEAAGLSDLLDAVADYLHDAMGKDCLLQECEQGYWVVVMADTFEPVLPVDGNTDEDEGMLVYRSRKAAMASARYQKNTYHIDTRAVRLGAEKRNVS
jgi:hypothetical protein